jgi:pimeloyl-ACP methyl ester carboxylesterase
VPQASRCSTCSFEGTCLPVFVQVAFLLAALAFLIALAVSIQCFRHPMAMMVWLRRKRLQRDGFARTTVETTVGPQIVWRGGSGPLLVLLHGAGDQASTWHKIAADLSRTYSLVMPDLAGHGQSAPPSGPLSIGTILATLEQVLDSDSWKPHRFILAGNSLGAWIAMLYTHKHPDRISRLLLINGGALKGLQTEITLTPKSREEARRTFDAILDPATPRPPGFVLDDLIRVTNHGPMARLIATEAEIPNYVLDGKLRDFRVPIDIVWGASDRLVPIDYARAMEAQLPAARLTVIERCGHAPQLECSAKLLKVLHSVLEAAAPTEKSYAPRGSANP